MKLFSVRAAGGHLLHYVAEGSRTSLCGHTPRSRPGATFRRAAWYRTSAAYKPCAKCAAAKEKLPQDDLTIE